jgi:hypothetical protein
MDAQRIEEVIVVEVESGSARRNHNKHSPPPGKNGAASR